MSGPIIATTDFEARADRAIDRAIALGKQLDRQVVVFHAREVAPYASPKDHGLDEKMRGVLPAGAEDVQVAYAHGPVPPTIAEFADDSGATLIAMGVARRNSIGDYFLGTCVDHVIRRTNVPVLVVKQRPRRPYRTIAVATDFSAPSRAAVDWAAKLFPEAPIHLVHAFHVPYAAWNRADYVRTEIDTFAREQMDTFIADLPDGTAERVTPHIVHGTVGSAVNGLIASEGIDLVVLGSHGETGFRHATIGSQANALLGSVHADAVIVGPRVSD